MNRLRYIYRGLKSLIKWAPVIYRDRNWDYSYLMTIQRTKLEFMLRELTRPNAYVIQDEKDIQDLRDCIEAHKRIEVEDYEDLGGGKVKDLALICTIYNRSLLTWWN